VALGFGFDFPLKKTEELEHEQTEGNHQNWKFQ
jgi:hypothetical protein